MTIAIRLAFIFKPFTPTLRVSYLIPGSCYQATAATVLLTLIGLANRAGAEVQEFNRRATATAQIMAGISPAGSDLALDRLTKLDAFVEHQKSMAVQWSQARGRISAIQN
ncbi:MAG: hypothetical protein HYV01_21110 [Deltaproteobacteria bacterium]|nr:hypothetical protein [Deltaproteobacteria bacterium]